MVKVKNANVGRDENVEEGGSSRGRTATGNEYGGILMINLEDLGTFNKSSKVPSRVKAPERFISMKDAANFEEWTRKRRKIAPDHREISWKYDPSMGTL
ncbi:hypothetical protein M9H77_35907 [Catharanthus roseus]|uniref:Uncharacterized protein n=1 Tax=Catharanthus roseus TaxID=4058 RepID=A0ACB9ZSJ0_CATRO|nr:hypothetical protein M9H77_35907 [Catharanthus roseus]